MTSENEYVVYKSGMVSKKNEFPDVVYIYLSESFPHTTYSKDIQNAYVFYDRDEAFETADLLGMDVGLLEMNVRRIRQDTR